MERNGDHVRCDVGVELDGDKWFCWFCFGSAKGVSGIFARKVISVLEFRNHDL